MLVISTICGLIAFAFGLTSSETLGSTYSELKSSFAKLIQKVENQNSNLNHQYSYSSLYPYPSNTGYHNQVSSREDATDLGYEVALPSSIGIMSSDSNIQNGQPIMYHYQVQPIQQSNFDGSYGSTGGDYYEDNDMKGGGGGEIGLLGLLGLKGLKGVGIVKKLKAAAALLPLAPILLPILLPILGPIIAPLLLLLVLPLILAPIILPILLLFVPIPVIVIGNGRSRPELVETAWRIFEPSMNEGCAGKITCEISRAAKLYGVDTPWIMNFIKKSNQSWIKYKWVEKMSRSLNDSTDCKLYKCKIVNSFKKMLKIQD